MTNELRTGAFHLQRSYVVDRWGIDDYRRWVEKELHTLMQTKLFEIVSDGRDYMIRVDSQMYESPGLEGFGLDTRTLHYSALVLLRRLDQAQVGEYVVGGAYHAPPSKGRRHLALVPSIGNVEIELTKFTSHDSMRVEEAWCVVAIHPMSVMS